MASVIDRSDAIDAITPRMPATPPDVYAVIPVYNRLALTLGCLDQLKRQTYSAITPIVVDGGSTDDTVATIRRDHPDVVLLSGSEPLFWTGATRVGIDWVLERAEDDAFVLLLNNDTTFDPDYVDQLVEVALRERAAVGGVNVDSRDMTTPVNAGVKIDWVDYGFPLRLEIPNDDIFNDDVDVLNGRGVLVPLAMIKVAGNVDDKAFPHYIADYEFFCRLRAHGFRIGIHQKAMIGAMVAESGLDPTSQDRSIADWSRSLFDRRSRNNVIDHWRFIGRHAPRHDRFRLRLMQIERCLGQLLNVLMPLDSPRGRYNLMLRRAGYLATYLLRQPFRRRRVS